MCWKIDGLYRRALEASDALPRILHIVCRKRRESSAPEQESLTGKTHSRPRTEQVGAFPVEDPNRAKQKLA